MNAARKKKPSKNPMALGRLAVVGTEFSVTTLVGLFLGNWVDGKIGTGPWLAMIGLVGGAAAGFFHMFRVLKRAEAEAESHD